MIVPEKPELALGLMAGRQRAWHKTVITCGLIFAVGRVAKLNKGKYFSQRAPDFPPSSGDLMF